MKTSTRYRIAAAAFAFALYCLGVLFVAWGSPPGEWDPITRLLTFFFGVAISGYSACFPFPDTD